MKLDVKIELLKFFFAIVNTIFLVLGLSVFGCAVWILFSTGSFLNFLSSEELRVVAAGLFMIGLVVVAVSVSGCVGVSSEQRCLLLVYLGFLIVLVLGQLFVTLLLLINRNQVENSLSDTVDQTIYQYGNKSDGRGRIMDSVQHYAECCGRTSPADWLNNVFIQSLNLTSPDVLPCSCFRSQQAFNSSWCSENRTFTDPIGEGDGAFNQSCSQKLSDWLQENILTIVGMDVGLILIQIANLSIVVSLYQMFGRRSALKRRNRLVDQDQAHSDHDPDDDDGEENYACMDPDGRHSDLSTMDRENPNYQDQNQDQMHLELQ